jgi:hypothetical protein
MFANDDRLGQQIDLLEDPGIFVQQRDLAMAIRASVVVIVKEMINLRFLKRFSLVARMSWLPAPLAFAFLLARALRFRRLHDIAGRRLGRIARILSGLGQLRLQGRNSLDQLLKLQFQNRTIRTRCCHSLTHGDNNLTQIPPNHEYQFLNP